MHYYNDLSFFPSYKRGTVESTVSSTITIQDQTEQNRLGSGRSIYTFSLLVFLRCDAVSLRFWTRSHVQEPLRHRPGPHGKYTSDRLMTCSHSQTQRRQTWRGRAGPADEFSKNVNLYVNVLFSVFKLVEMFMFIVLLRLNHKVILFQHRVDCQEATRQNV